MQRIAELVLERRRAVVEDGDDHDERMHDILTDAFAAVRQA